MSYIIGGIIILLALILAFVIYIKIKVMMETKRLYESFIPGITEMMRMQQERDAENNIPKD